MVISRVFFFIAGAGVPGRIDIQNGSELTGQRLDHSIVSFLESGCSVNHTSEENK